MFYYLMKLHYSQTYKALNLNYFIVLLPYEITLFSNVRLRYIYSFSVLLPYEITLFSNPLFGLSLLFFVLLPYEITLFSNLK